MRQLIAIPVYHISAKIGVDKGRAWSVVDELLLWRVDRSPQTIAELVAASSLPRPVVVASLARMMRFRLVNVAIVAGNATFRSSKIGTSVVGSPLPYFPKRTSRNVRFVVDKATGTAFRNRDVRLMPVGALERERRRGVDVRLVAIDDGEPAMSQETNIQRLSELAVRGHDETLAAIHDLAVNDHSDEVMAVDVVDGAVKGLPRDVNPELRALVGRIARKQAPGEVRVKYAGPRSDAEEPPKQIACDVQPEDVLVGGEAHKLAFLALLAGAKHRVIVHSTFLSLERFEELVETFRDTCRRGVTIDILWGADSDDETNVQNATSAAQIAETVHDDPDLAGKIRVCMRSTSSHAKVLLGDVSATEWVGVIGSCNWLSSPFRSVELSVVLRSPNAVSEVARVLGRLIGRRSAFDDLAAELGLLSVKLGRQPSSTLSGSSVVILPGPAHEELARAASGRARRRFVIGSHRLGATSRSGALIQSVTAAARAGVKATVIYTRASGPLGRADAAALEQEMATEGVFLASAPHPKLHGKFLAWDDDDIVVTSLNWASASVDPASPQSELGVHLHAVGLGADVLGRIAALLPNLEAPGWPNPAGTC